jgi:peptidoglycan/LPS O-acetylase OafA/YrhL
MVQTPGGTQAPSPPAEAAGGRIPELDGLRALMALWLVVVHAGQLSGLAEADSPVVRLLLTGQARVHVFMMLSGFVIGALLARRRPPYGRFLRDRAARLFPIWLLALGLAVALRPLQAEVYAGALWIGEDLRASMLSRIALESEQLPWHLLAHAALLHGLVPEQWLPQSDMALLGPGWSLSAIWQFYLVAPLLPLLMFRWRLAVVAWIALPLLHPAFVEAAALAGLSFGYATLLEHLPLFLIGMATAQLLPALRALPPEALRAALGVGWAVAALAALGRADRVGALLLWMPLIIWTLALWAVLDREAALARAGRAVLAAPPLRALGGPSYALFLLHLPLLNLVAWLCAGSGAERAGPLAWGLWLTLAGGTLSVAAAVALHRWVELPVDRWLRGPPGERQAAAGAAAVAGGGAEGRFTRPSPAP